MTTRTSVRALATAIGLVVILAACGSDNSSSAVATTTVTTTVSGTGGSGNNAALCAARDNLKSSITDLTNVNVVQSGTAGLQTALTKVKDNLQAVKSAASAEMQPQVKAFEDALGQLGTAITNVGSGGAGAVVTAASNAVSAGTTLVTSLNNLKCG
jgi:hypothetical protein